MTNTQSQFERLGSALADLYLQTPRISDLLGTYEARPCTEAWRLVKAQARTNEEKLIKLYNFVEALASEPIFASNPHLHDQIREIVEAESVRFYSAMRCFPEAPMPMDESCVHALVEHAKRFDQHSQEKTLEFQRAVELHV